jgi:hypothetical protein
MKQFPHQPDSMMCNQEYECPYLPMGFVVKINLYSNYGDFHYLGLNGIEIYDQTGACLTDLKNSKNTPSVYANPHSVSLIAGIEGDIRTPDKLLNGSNNTF